MTKRQRTVTRVFNHAAEKKSVNGYVFSRRVSATNYEKTDL